MSLASTDSVDNTLKVLYRIWGICAFSLLFLLVLRSPAELKYDEVYHIGLAKLINQQGFLLALNSPDNQSAAGPLFSLVHLSTQYLTSLTAPAIRWVNVILILGVVASSWGLLRRRCTYSFEAAISLLGVPFIWPTMGLALTEVPALLAFACFSLLIQLTFAASSFQKALVLSVGAGLALGLAILGRQTYLIAVPVLLLFAVLYRDKLILISCILLAAAMVAVWPFLLWQGLVPPSQAHTSGGLVFYHGILGLSYMGAASMILNPLYFLSDGRKFVLPSLMISIPIAILFLSDISPPGKSTLSRICPSLFLPYAIFATKVGLSALGICWLTITLRDLFLRRHEPNQTLDNLMAVAFAIAPMKVSHLFSSRYIVGGLTTECSRTSTKFQPSYWHLLLLTVSTLAGANSLVAYYSY